MVVPRTFHLIAVQTHSLKKSVEFYCIDCALQLMVSVILYANKTSLNIEKIFYFMLNINEWNILLLSEAFILINKIIIIHI